MPSSDEKLLDATRRRFLAVTAAAGLGGTMLAGVLLGMVTGDAAAQKRSRSGRRLRWR
jgi:hypothetical protein